MTKQVNGQSEALHTRRHKRRSEEDTRCIIAEAGACTEQGDATSSMTVLPMGSICHCLGVYFDFYNTERRHQSLGQMTSEPVYNLPADRNAA